MLAFLNDFNLGPVAVISKDKFQGMGIYMDKIWFLAK